MALVHYLIFMIVFVIVLYIVLKIKQQRNPLNAAPGLQQTLLFGMAENHLVKNFRYFDFYQNQRKKFGTVRKVYYPLGKVGLEVSDPEWVKYVLITAGSNFENGTFLGDGFFKQAVGENGLVVVNGEQHKTYKKILSPAYKLSTLKKSMPIVVQCGERMVNLFNDYCRNNKIASGPYAGSSAVDVKHLFNKTTLDIAVMFLLGYDLRESCSWDLETFGDYLWKVLEMQDNVFTLASVFYITSSFVRSLRKLLSYLPNEGTWLVRTTNKMHHIIEDIIETSISDLRRKNEINDASFKGNTFRPLLSYMLDMSTGINLSRQEIHDLTMTFIIGGHETASISLMWTLYELCKKPEHQATLREEVTRVFKEHDDKIDWDDMSSKKFPFLNAVVKESLRMYPPVPWLPRVSANPDMIDGHHVPANTRVIVITSELQRNPDIWPDPDEFKPERFLEPEDTIPWGAWLPFGEGFHKCIGYQFGLIEVGYLLAQVIKNFKFAVDPTINYHEHVYVSLNSVPTMKLYVTPL